MRDVQRAVRLARGASIQSAAQAALSDLDGVDPRAWSISELTGAGIDLPSGSLGAVTSTVELSLLSDTEMREVLELVKTVLSPNGRLFFLDHSGHAGGLMGQLLSRQKNRSLAGGLYCGRNLPETVRGAGFIITDIERFVMPTKNPLLRSWVQGVAMVSPRLNGFQV